MKLTGVTQAALLALGTTAVVGATITVFVLANGLMDSSTTVASAQAQEAFEFAVFGDTGYAPNQEPMVDNLLDALNGRHLEFVVHVGDFGGPSAGSCTDEHRGRRLAQFQASVHPLIYTPGDNDWTDCWEERAGSYDALERLSSLRETLFSGEQSLGRRTVPLSRQSAHRDYAAFRENVRWTQAA